MSTALDRFVMRKVLAVVLLPSVAVGLYLLDGGGVILIDGVPVEVTQGPAWLAQVLYDPPAWVFAVVGAVGVAVVATAYVGYRRSGLDDEVKAEMLGNALVVGLIAACTIALSSTDALPYWADVLGGSVMGFTLAMTAQARLGL